MVKSSRGILLHVKNYIIKDAKANVLIIHGLNEHCGRYTHVASALNEIGISVYTFDLRGHGKSEGEPSFVKDIDEYREDVENIFRTIPKNIPLFILGHSMGGMIAVKFLLFNEKTQVSGVILTGAALEVGTDITPLTQKVVGFLGKVAPKLKTVKLDPTSISRDPLEVEKYINDPLIHREGGKAGLALALLNEIKALKQQFKNFTYPVLIMHGESDKITNPEGSKSLYQQAVHKDKTLKLWEGAYHEIFNETNKAEVIAYMVSWIKNRL
jgi:alpha-beta hydrolase superfamily lysophospholipase